MANYFWDTGLIIGYSFYYEKSIPKNITQSDFDSHSQNVINFLQKTNKSTHIISEESITEVGKKLKERENGVKKLVFLKGQKRSKINLNALQMDERGDEWVDEKIILFEKCDPLELCLALIDLLATAQVRADYLITKIVKVHHTFDWKQYTELKKLFHPSDAKIMSYALNYHNTVQEINFISTDSGFENMVSKIVASIKNAKIPEITMLWNYNSQC